MKVCFDTSVVIDILGKTQWFKDSFAAYDVAMLRRFEPCLSVSSTTDIVYVLHSRGIYSGAEALEVLAAVFDMFDLLDNTASDCRLAYQSDMKDYEDALIAFAARRHNVDLIITRDKRGFATSPVPAVSPKEFLDIYKPPTWENDFVEL